MSCAWETTAEDVENVCRNNGMSISGKRAAEILEELDTDKVEREALRGDDMSEQVDYAYIEIWEQIVSKGLDE